MCGRFFRFFWVMGLMVLINLSLTAQNLPQKNEDYKKWSLEELLFTIDSGLLDENTRLAYIEFYLQKAKKENSIEDVVTGYQKKIANLKEYNVKSVYADSLIELGHNLNDKRILGVAYDYKMYVEYVAKDYKSALKYGLQAESILKEVNDLYSLNSIKNYIGSIYYHLEDYSKAYQFFDEATIYYKENLSFSYNAKKNYINNLFGLGKSANRLQKYDTLEVLIQEGYKGIQELKSHRQPLEVAYFSLLDGMCRHSSQQYRASDSLLQKALPLIKENNDYANEHLAYLYLGKNAWELGKKQMALSYFEKVESLYLKEGFINSELSEAYTYLINYYKEDKNLEKQLNYTNTLLGISNELQATNKDLTDYLHKNLDAQKLEDSKAKLEKAIQNNQRWRNLLYTMTGVLVVFVGMSWFFAYKKPKHLKVGVAAEQVNKPLKKEKEITPQILSTEEILLQKLVKFEEDKGFLQKITLEDLADTLSTNRTTLSQVLNEHKGGFKIYIKKLRITYAQSQIEQNPKLQQLNFDALAAKFGFGSGRSFSNAFKEITGINLNDYLQTNKENLVS